MRRFILVASVSGLLWLAPTVSAENKSAEQRGLEIAQQAEHRAEGYDDSRGVARMLIRPKGGGEAVRELSFKSLELPDGSRSLAVVQAPKDIAGTALLTHSNDDAPDEQWIWLPAVKRVKRIASANKSGQFLGSEFTYEDFTAQPVEKYRFKLLREEQLRGMPAYVLERIPKDASESIYSKHVAWLDKEYYRTLQVHFYNRAGDHQKTLSATDFEQHQDKYWRPHKLVMKNLQTDAESILEWLEIDLGVGLDKRDFDINSLKRAR